MSKMALSSANPIVAELVETGIIPPRCRKFQIVIEAGQPIKFVSESFVDEAEFRKLADIFKDNPGAADQSAREFVFTEIETKRKLEIK